MVLIYVGSEGVSASSYIYSIGSVFTSSVTSSICSNCSIFSPFVISSIGIEFSPSVTSSACS